MKKQVLLMITLFIFVMTLVSSTAMAASSKPAITLKLSSDGVLTVSGKGMLEYEMLSERFIYGHSHLGIPVKKVVIEKGVTGIGDYAFAFFQALEQITIPNTVTYIGDCAFSECIRLKNISISKYVVNDKLEDAFGGNDSLTSITVNSGNKKYASKNGLLLSKDKKTLLYVPEGMKNVVIPDTVTSVVYRRIFQNTKMESVTIGKKLTDISDLFQNCKNLKSVDIPKTVTKMSHAFAHSGLTSAIIRGGVTRLEGVFYDCRELKTVVIPTSVEEINTNTFYNCISLKNIYYTGSKSQWAKVKVYPIYTDSDKLTVTKFNYKIK